MSKIGRQIRNLVLVIMVIALSFSCTLELLQIQIVDGEYYLSQTTGVYGINQNVQASRGQIMTSFCEFLVTTTWEASWVGDSLCCRTHDTDVIFVDRKNGVTR